MFSISVLWAAFWMVIMISPYVLIMFFYYSQRSLLRQWENSGQAKIVLSCKNQQEMLVRHPIFFSFTLSKVLEVNRILFIIFSEVSFHVPLLGIS